MGFVGANVLDPKATAMIQPPCPGRGGGEKLKKQFEDLAEGTGIEVEASRSRIGVYKNVTISFNIIIFTVYGV